MPQMKLMQVGLLQVLAFDRRARESLRESPTSRPARRVCRLLPFSAHGTPAC